MDYDFYIVGKKDNDCYVVYDGREGMGGKACASRYTLGQLFGEGYSICGLNAPGSDGKITAKDVRVMSLDGVPSRSRSTFPSVPRIKRSCSTFIKGIKRSKEEIARAKEIGQKRGEAIKKKHATTDKTKGEILAFFKEYAEAGFQKTRFTAAKALRVYNYGLKNQQRIGGLENLFDKHGNSVPVYYCREKNQTVTKQELLDKYDEILASFCIRDGMVSYNIMYGGTPQEIVEYILENTTKPIKYTFGFKYRHPTTYEVPINKEQALRYFRDSMCDMTEHTDYIDLNAYSENDML